MGNPAGAIVILVMGVAGSGKTCVSRALSSELGWQFLDADDFHSAANVAKMAAGIPLSDLDRKDWLDALHREVDLAIRSQKYTVLACSALRQAYRSQIWEGPEMQIVYLSLNRAEAALRVQKREQHFMPESLVQSQFETLEEPVNALKIDATLPLPEICKQVISQFQV